LSGIAAPRDTIRLGSIFLRSEGHTAKLAPSVVARGARPRGPVTGRTALVEKIKARGRDFAWDERPQTGDSFHFPLMAGCRRSRTAASWKRNTKSRRWASDSFGETRRAGLGRQRHFGWSNCRRTACIWCRSGPRDRERLLRRVGPPERLSPYGGAALKPAIGKANSW